MGGLTLHVATLGAKAAGSDRAVLRDLIVVVRCEQPSQRGEQDQPASTNEHGFQLPLCDQRPDGRQAEAGDPVCFGHRHRKWIKRRPSVVPDLD
jgi:hypothetical protein